MEFVRQMAMCYLGGGGIIFGQEEISQPTKQRTKQPKKQQNS